jgi:hypothetical protein
MTRDIRVGSRYGCDTEINVSGDCVTGGSVFHYTPNTAVSPEDQIKYTLANSRIQKTNYGGSQAPVYTTAAEIVIETLRFYVIGTAAQDGKQPKVVIVIKGHAGSGRDRSEFNIETTVSQRAIDS